MSTPKKGLAAKKPDMVNHPPHYTAHPAGIECIDVIEHMSVNLGSAIRYIWRCMLKGNTLEDIDKAIWYLQREKARLQKFNLL